MDTIFRDANNLPNSIYPFRISAKCIVILEPLRDATNLNITFKVRSVTKMKTKQVGQAFVDLILYLYSLENCYQKRRIRIDDLDNVIQGKLEDWVPQITHEIEKKVLLYKTDENEFNMVNELFNLRKEVKEQIMSTPIQEQP